MYDTVDDVKKIKTEDAGCSIYDDITIERDEEIQQMKNTYATISYLKILKRENNLPETEENETSSTEGSLQIDDRIIESDDEIQQMVASPSTIPNLKDFVNENNSSENEVNGAKHVSQSFVNENNAAKMVESGMNVEVSQDFVNENNSSETAENEVNGAKHVAQSFMNENNAAESDMNVGLNVEVSQVLMTKRKPSEISKVSEGYRLLKLPVVFPLGSVDLRNPSEITECEINLTEINPDIAKEKRSKSKIPQNSEVNNSLNFSKISKGKKNFPETPKNIIENQLISPFNIVKKKKIVSEIPKNIEENQLVNFSRGVINGINSSKTMRNEVNPVGVKPQGSVNENNSSRTTQSEINPYLGTVKRRISKIPKKAEGSQLINSSRITNKKKNASGKQKIIEGNQLVKSRGARKKSVSKVQNSLKENPAENSVSPLMKKRKTSKIMKTSGEYGSSNFPSGLINKNNSTKKVANEIYPVGLNSQVINKNNSTKTAANEINPPRINPQVAVRSVVPEIPNNIEKNSTVILYQIIKKKTQTSNKTSIFKENPLANPSADFIHKSNSIATVKKEVLLGLHRQGFFNKNNSSEPPENLINPTVISPQGLINNNNSTKKAANEVYPVGLNSQLINKNNSTKTAADGINPQVFFNKNNSSKLPENSINPTGISPQVLVRRIVVPEIPNNIEKNSTVKLYQVLKKTQRSNKTNVFKENPLANPSAGFFNKKNSSNPPKNLVNPTGISPQALRDEIPMDIEDSGPIEHSSGVIREESNVSEMPVNVKDVLIENYSGSANKKWRKSWVSEEFMCENYFFPRRSQRIRLMAERRQNEANLPTNTEPVEKKVSAIQKKRKPRIITEDSQKRNLPRNVSQSALSSCTILSPNARCHDKVPESITGIFTKEGKNYVTLKWKHSEEEDYILEDNLTDSMKVLLSDYVEAIRLRSQLSQLQDTLPAGEETSQSTEMPSSSNGGENGILSPKFIKNNIMNFKNKQKLCIEENNLFDNLSAYTVDVKFHI